MTAISTAEPRSTCAGAMLDNTGDTATRPSNRPSAKPSDRIVSARDSGTPCAIKWRASQFHTPHSAAT